MLEFRLLGSAALAGLLGAVMVLNPAPEFDSGQFVQVRRNGGQTIAVGQLEVTWRQWNTCFAAHGCQFLPKNPLRNARADAPVTGVNYFDVAEYLAWANSQADARYRLPSADEWAEISGGLSRRATVKLFDDPRLAWAADYGAIEQVLPKPRPSGAFGVAANGVADLAGNVWEWTSTCSAAISGEHLCPVYVAAGLHEANISIFVRDPLTGGCSSGTPPANLGFRLVREAYSGAASATGATLTR